MSRTEHVDEIVVILRARVGVADQERDRRAGRRAFVEARQNFDVVGLAALRGVARFARRATIEIGAEILDRNRESRRAAVDDAADRGAVAFAEGRDGEEFSE
jgi:hypothetical protein